MKLPRVEKFLWTHYLALNHNMYGAQVVEVVREQLVRILDGPDGVSGGIMEGNSWVTENSSVAEFKEV